MRKRIKIFFTSVTSTFDFPIVINSYGRSGSTVLTRSIAQAGNGIKSKKLRDIAAKSNIQGLWSLGSSQLKKGVVYKTHDYPPDNYYNHDIRMIYTFANPIDVVLSLHRLFEEKGEEWIKEHYEHLKVPFRYNFNLIEEDQLRLENHLESWLDEKRIPIAFVRYESMWDYQTQISDFLGFNIQLPLFKKRKAKEVEEKKIEKTIKCTYSRLIKKIDNLDDFFVLNKNLIT